MITECLGIAKDATGNQYAVWNVHDTCADCGAEMHATVPVAAPVVTFPHQPDGTHQPTLAGQVAEVVATHRERMHD